MRHARAVLRGGGTAEGVVTRFNSEGVTLVAKESRTIPLTELVRMDFSGRSPRLDGRDPVVVLANGDLLAAIAEEADSENIEARWSRFGALPPLTIPIESVRCLIFQRARAADLRLWKRIADEKASDDAVWLTNGDAVRGELTRFDRRTVELAGDDRGGSIARTNVVAVLFNSELAHVEAPKTLSGLVTLVDGSRFRAVGLKLVPGDMLQCRTAFGAELEFPPAAVCSIQFCGGCATWLSDLTPEFEFTPFLGVDWPWRGDRNCLAEPLKLRGVDYASGVGVHSRATLRYRLDGRYREFHAVVGVDDSAGGRGDALFEVLADGESLWRRDRIGGRDAALVVGPLNVQDRRELVLHVDYGVQGDVLDHADWCDAVLVR